MAASDARWAIVAEAGLYEIDRQCDLYLGALYTFNRDQRAARQGLTAVGATTAAILGITGAAGTTIALTAAAFGLAATLFDAGANSVLFTIEPSALRAVMLRGRQAYLATVIWREVTNRPRMMVVLQGYLSQCTPAAIEANINNAATGALSVSSTNTDAALKAAALAAPSASIVQNPEVLVARPTITVVQTPTVPVPLVPPPAPVPGTRPQEIGIKPAEITDIQLTLCVTPGELTSPQVDAQTRTAIRQFMSGRFGGDPSTKNDLMTSGPTASRLRQAAADARSGNAIANCDARGYGSAYEVGLFEHLPTPEARAKKVQVFQNMINGKLHADTRIPVDGTMATLHTGVGRLRQQMDVNDKATALDADFFKKLAAKEN